jgi:hypothetical protein
MFLPVFPDVPDNGRGRIRFQLFNGPWGGPIALFPGLLSISSHERFAKGQKTHPHRRLHLGYHDNEAAGPYPVARQSHSYEDAPVQHSSSRKVACTF